MYLISLCNEWMSSKVCVIHDYNKCLYFCNEWMWRTSMCFEWVDGVSVSKEWRTHDNCAMKMWPLSLLECFSFVIYVDSSICFVKTSANSFDKCYVFQFCVLLKSQVISLDIASKCWVAILVLYFWHISTTVCCKIWVLCSRLYK